MILSASPVVSPIAKCVHNNIIAISIRLRLCALIVEMALSSMRQAIFVLNAAI